MESNYVVSTQKLIVAELTNWRPPLDREKFGWTISTDYGKIISIEGAIREILNDGEHSPFSNWHKVEFTEDEITFNCTEQYMMYKKAMLFNDSIIAAQILQETFPKEHKKLGRLVKNFNESIWNENCTKIVYNGNKLKFTQNPHLLKILLDTKGKLLVEASPFDVIWGIGMSAEEAQLVDKSKWKGQNLLGKILTQLREDLLKEL